MKIGFSLIFSLAALHADIDFMPIPDETAFVLYQMIKDAHEILEESGVHYWIHAGTLLGAIRHGGLIPWDDDIDIIIDKNEEEKFMSLIPIFDS